MSRRFLAFIAAAALAAAGCDSGLRSDSDVQAPAEAASSTAEADGSVQAADLVIVPAGTRIRVALDTGLNSGRNSAGDAFSASVLEDVRVEGRLAIPAGSTVHGEVKSVRPAKRGAGDALMALAVTRLETVDGYSTSLVASLSRRSESKKKRNAAIIGGGAAGGALLGRIIGKDTKGAVVGSILGGAAGTGVVMSKEGEQVDLPAGATLTIRLDQEVNLPVVS